MRRRYVRAVEREERQSILLMAAGAIAGAAAGLYLGRRYRTLDAFLDDVRERIADLRETWYDDDELEDSERDLLESSDAGPGGLDAGDDEIEDESHSVSADDADDAEDELEDDLASVSRDNGAAVSPTAEARARRLEERVLRALRSDRVVRERAVEIAVVGEGVVELTGTVHGIEEISRAASVARRVPGVSMVLNRIEVRSGGHMDTASVARDDSAAPDPGAPRAPAG